MLLRQQQGRQMLTIVKKKGMAWKLMVQLVLLPGAHNSSGSSSSSDAARGSLSGLTLLLLLLLLAGVTVVRVAETTPIIQGVKVTVNMTIASLMMLVQKRLCLRRTPTRWKVAWSREQLLSQATAKCVAWFA
jgi:hypothetical protein